eukprot:ctg_786.g158
MKGAALPVSSADDWEALETRTATRSRGERPEQASSILPVWLSFFFFGVVNNFAYVVFLSAAEAMVERHAGAVLFADVVPGLLLKTSVGWWLHRVRYAVRVYGVSVGNFAAFVVAAAMASVASTTLSVAAMLAAVACVSLMGALGEATFLALTARYGQPALAAWSSGTGFAGIAGAGLYALLTNVLGVRPSRTLMLLAPVPLLMGVTYAAARLPADAPAASEGLRSDADAPNTQRKWSMVYRLIPRYLAPLLVVYWAEYTINQGLLPTTDVNDWIQPSATRDAGAPIRHARYAMLQLSASTMGIDAAAVQQCGGADGAVHAAARPTHFVAVSYAGGGGGGVLRGSAGRCHVRQHLCGHPGGGAAAAPRVDTGRVFGGRCDGYRCGQRRVLVGGVCICAGGGNTAWPSIKKAAAPKDHAHTALAFLASDFHRPSRFRPVPERGIGRGARHRRRGSAAEKCTSSRHTGLQRCSLGVRRRRYGSRFVAAGLVWRGWRKSPGEERVHRSVTCSFFPSSIRVSRATSVATNRPARRLRGDVEHCRPECSGIATTTTTTESQEQWEHFTSAPCMTEQVWSHSPASPSDAHHTPVDEHCATAQAGCLAPPLRHAMRPRWSEPAERFFIAFMETVQQRRCRDAPDTALYQLAQAWCWGAVKSLPHNADAMRLDLTAEQVPLADPYLWRALGECLYAVGQRDAASVAYVVEVDVSGQQLSNQDATWLLWSLHALPARWPRALRLAYTGITAFGALEGASATDDIPEPPSVSRTHRGVHALVLDGCPLRSLGRAAPAHLFATVRVLHLANTAVQSMWTLADDLEHLGMPVQHLWLVPASAERQAPPMWPNARTVGTNAEPDVQQLIRRHRRGHLDTSLNGGADPRWNGPSTVERHGPSRDTSAAIVDNMLPLSHDTVGESLITAWSLLESYARRAPSPLLQEPLLDVFLAGRVRTLQTVDGRRLSHGHRVLHALCCERHAHDCSERMLQQHRVAETLSARETGAFGCIGPAAPLTWAHAFEAARVRQASTQPAAVLVFPAAGRARQFEYHPPSSAVWRWAPWMARWCAHPAPLPRQAHQRGQVCAHAARRVGHLLFGWRGGAVGFATAATGVSGADGARQCDVVLLGRRPPAAGVRRGQSGGAVGDGIGSAPARVDRSQRPRNGQLHPLLLPRRQRRRVHYFRVVRGEQGASVPGDERQAAGGGGDGPGARSHAHRPAADPVVERGRRLCAPAATRVRSEFATESASAIQLLRRPRLLSSECVQRGGGGGPDATAAVVVEDSGKSG